jgi:isochorismate synthase
MDKEAQLYVGGGITAGSDAEKEWEETRNKTGTIMAVVNKSELE